MSIKAKWRTENMKKYGIASLKHKNTFNKILVVNLHKNK